MHIQNDAVAATAMEVVIKRVYEHTHGSPPSVFDVYLLSFSFNDVGYTFIGAYISS